MADTNLVPERYTLERQVSEILIREIRRGSWKGWLPAERSLSATLQVSRNTLRKALHQLERNGVLKPQHGFGHRIVKSGAFLAAKSRPLVGLIVPAALHELRPGLTLWIDELRGLLYGAGCQLNLYEGKQYLRGVPSPALIKLTGQTPHACWILALTTERLQRWALRHRLPCVVAGSVWPGVGLPSVDLDHHSICRHAAGEMIRLGHRRIVFLNEASGRAGEHDSETGFREGVGQFRLPDLSAKIMAYAPATGELCRLLSGLFQQKSHPTALLVGNSHYYLTVMGFLHGRGLRVPDDVSVISRDDDPFLSYAVPAPTRYVHRPHVFARRLIRPVLQTVHSIPVPVRKNLIVPEFFRGRTLGPPP